MAATAVHKLATDSFSNYSTRPCFKSPHCYERLVSLTGDKKKKRKEKKEKTTRTDLQILFLYQSSSRVNRTQLAFNENDSKTYLRDLDAKRFPLNEIFLNFKPSGGSSTRKKHLKRRYSFRKKWTLRKKKEKIDIDRERRERARGGNGGRGEESRARSIREKGERSG